MDKIITTKEHTGELIHEYIGARTITESVFEGYESMDNTKPSYKSVESLGYSESKMIIQLDNGELKHILVADIIKIQSKEEYLKDKEEKEFNKSIEEYIDGVKIELMRVVGIGVILTEEVLKDELILVFSNNTRDLDLMDKHKEVAIPKKSIVDHDVKTLVDDVLRGSLGWDC